MKCPTCGNAAWDGNEPPAPPPAFAIGDRVGWSHAVSTRFPAGSVLVEDYFASAVETAKAVKDVMRVDVAAEELSVEEDPSGKSGTVIAEAGRNLWEVQLDGEKSIIVLTSDELVKLVKGV